MPIVPAGAVAREAGAREAEGSTGTGGGAQLTRRGSFRDRKHAGQLLAGRLSAARLAARAVLALPRGGVPVGAEIARALGVPLDVLGVRKVGVPWQPELALGAVAEGGVRVLNEDVARHTGLPAGAVDDAVQRAERELAERLGVLRGALGPVDVRGAVVVLTDDGVATGATVRAGVAALRERGAARIVLAVPVAARDVARALAAVVDDLVCLQAPRDLRAVGSWYDDFGQVDDAEVRDLLLASRHRPGHGQEAGAEQP